MTKIELEKLIQQKLTIDQYKEFVLSGKLPDGLTLLETYQRNWCIDARAAVVQPISIKQDQKSALIKL
jgi:hypothetical protein